ESLIFENCIASSPWTVPSHASLFTGFYPTEHGSHGILDPKKKVDFGFALPDPLSEKFMTLAEIFADNGYLTAASISNPFLLDPALKLTQGFQILDSPRTIAWMFRRYAFRPILYLFCYLTNIYPEYNIIYRRADVITNQSIHLLEKFVSSSIFLFVNYMDAHIPYGPPRPFAGYFLDTAFPQIYRLKQHFLRLKNRVKEKSWYSYQLSQYDGEIAYLDDELGRFFSRLKKMGLYDASLIIVTSDHGELFGEHGFKDHRTPMYEGVIKIPLLIKFPHSSRVGREKKMITLADLFPTILSICGLPIKDGISGKAFGDESSLAVSELYKFGIGEHRILYDGK
ncbi:MAG: sulfatase, partial [Candidatus Heimdallarchaeota archaeon]|nr:sulfatase [Candidatus Heimdallarchaeota archaeon]